MAISVNVKARRFLETVGDGGFLGALGTSLHQSTNEAAPAIFYIVSSRPHRPALALCLAPSDCDTRWPLITTQEEKQEENDEEEELSYTRVTYGRAGGRDLRADESRR